LIDLSLTSRDKNYASVEKTSQKTEICFVATKVFPTNKKAK